MTNRTMKIITYLVGITLVGLALFLAYEPPIGSVSTLYDKSQIKTEYDLKGNVLEKNGDVKVEIKTYAPEVKLSRWDEVSLTIKPLSSNATISFEGDKIKFSETKKDYYFYEVENGFEYDLTLKEKPETNIIQLQIQSEGLEFFYQPELTTEEVARGDIRPNNVVGSYAVYASEPKKNIVGGKLYRSGKVGHIYRPRIEDAVGNWVWGKLKIENGILSVEIQQEFLDKSVYPLKHTTGTTFGYTTIGGTEAGGDPNYLTGSHFTATAGTIASISYYGYRATTACNIQMGMYNHSTDALAGYTGSVSSGTAANWITANIVSGGSVSATTYKLVFNADNTNPKLFYDSATSIVYQKSGQNFGTWNDPVSSWTSWINPGIMSIYATYTGGETSQPNEDIIIINE